MERGDKGSALISVILVVLVLTMVGVASLFFMTTEDRITNISRLERSAFYAAETGLRAAETSMMNQFTNNPNICTALLSRARTTDNVFEVPNGGTIHPVAVVFTDPGVAEHQDPATLVTVPATEVRSVTIPGNNEGYHLTYSIFVRNDDDEMSDTVDTNNRVSVVAVGTLTTPMGTTIRKVLEEQLGPATGGGGVNAQYGQNQGGTGGVNIGPGG